MIQHIKLSQIAIVVVVISLFASITNFVPFSLTFLLLLLFVPYLIDRIPGNRMITALVILYLYFFTSTLIYNPTAFLNSTFYRRDGNFFISFLPLLLTAKLNKNFHTEKIVRIFIYFLTIINILCMILPRIEVNPDNLIQLENEKINHFLFAAHNAAGGFISIALSLNIGMLFSNKPERKPVLLLCALVNFIALYDTDSRGSLLGFLLGIFVLMISINPVFAQKKRRRQDMILFLGILIASIFLISFFADEETLNRTLGATSFADRLGTIAERMTILWPRAMEAFKESPIFGTGYGSYNDYPYCFSRIIPGLIAINDPSQYIYSDAHAHNTYLHVMAETGIIGLILLVILIWKMRDEIIQIDSKPLRIGLFIALQVNIYSSFTEHRFFTPSQMIPFMLVLGLALAENRGKRERIVYNEISAYSPLFTDMKGNI